MWCLFSENPLPYLDYLDSYETVVDFEANMQEYARDGRLRPAVDSKTMGDTPPETVELMQSCWSHDIEHCPDNFQNIIDKLQTQKNQYASKN